jgi:hypothetical protein
MFKKLKIKILSFVTLTLSLCILLVGFISYMAIRNIIYDNFISLSVKSTMQKMDTARMYLKLIEETSRQVSKNPRIIEALQKQNFDASTKLILDSLKLSYSGILGVTLFNSSDESFSSNNISSYPTLEQLKGIRPIGEFLSTDKASCWSVRNEVIAAYYNNTLYNSKYGIITYISKVYDEHNLFYGYLFVDINPDFIYDLLKNNQTGFSSDSITYIINYNGTVLPSKFYSAPVNRILEEIKTSVIPASNYALSSDNRNILVYSSFDNQDIKIVTFIPLESLFSELNRLLFIMVSAILVFISLSVLIGFSLRRSIAKPLADLFQKMHVHTQ